MDEDTIQELITELHSALDADVTASLAVIEARIVHEALTASTCLQAREAGSMDGKNADERADQRTVILADDERVTKSTAALAELEKRAAHAKVRVEVARAKVGLIKALLYSQSGAASGA